MDYEIQDLIVYVMSQEDQQRKLLNKKADCFRRMRESNNITDYTKEVKCPTWWDNLLCWEESEPDTLVSQPCPDYVNRFNKNENATRYCTENGTWSYKTCVGDACDNNGWTNFSLCYKPSIDIQFHAASGKKLWIVYTTGYSVSLAALTVALIIMFCCKGLRSKSNILHINLFLAFFLRAIISFIRELSFVSNVGFEKDVRRHDDGILEFIQNGPHWECKVIISLFHYTINASVMWIFIEALYLHMLIYRPLSTEKNGVKVYVILGWVLPMPFLIAWTFVKYFYDNTYCWNFQRFKSEYYWILKAPTVAVILINFFFFLDVLRILFIRARANQRNISGRKKYKKLAKFIVVLMPLFGVMYIVFYVAFPSSFSQVSDYKVIHLYIEMGYNSFQGFVLAVLFCFLNEQVHSEIKRIWFRHRSRRTDLANLNRSFGQNPSWKSSSVKSIIAPFSERRSKRKPLVTTSLYNRNDKSDDYFRKSLKTRTIKVQSKPDAIGSRREITPITNKDIAIENMILNKLPTSYQRNCPEQYV